LDHAKEEWRGSQGKGRKKKNVQETRSAEGLMRKNGGGKRDSSKGKNRIDTVETIEGKGAG